MFKNVKKEEITIPAQMSYLIQVREFIEHIGKKYRFQDKLINSFKLVVDEACTNVIRHGYRDIKNGEITLKAIIRRLSLTIIIIDQGKSYDPRQANTPDLAKYVDIGKRGGLGILMMRKLMDDMQYSVTERGNEFRLTKYREASHESALAQWWNALNLKTKYSIYATIIFTLLALFIFGPIYWNAERDVRSEALTVSATGGQALAANIVDDVLTENRAVLFENAYSLRTANAQYITEVFILDSNKTVLAWSNPSKTYGFSRYQIPEQASIADTISNALVYEYALNDTTNIIDLQADITMGGVSKVGEVHIWINQKTIDNITFHKKLRMILILLLILVLGYIPLFFLIHRILTPFHSLAEWVREVIHGKVDQDEIDIDASDEIGEIAQAFNEMTNKFREAQVTLMEQQKLQKELQVAQEIQQMLLPSDFPEVEGFEIASYYEAAKEVGGDLFDFVEVDQDTVGIIVADVSGKGVPGSLIMTMIRTAIRLESRGNKNPADVLARVNRFVADDMKRGMFVTMFYIILDSRDRMIHYASAGHNPMILYRGSTRQTYYLNPSGFPVGIQLPDLNLFAKTIQTDSIRLREDDILVLYTDGITEAMNAQRELYREERFLDAIRRNAHLDVGEFVSSINKDIKTFTGGAPQNDDITFVAIKEKMMSSEVKYKLQEELFRMIDSGMKVKDALKKLRVSPHQYYKYKEIIKRKGMDGLKGYFEEQDTVEKKHLSIEVKTKIFDIIRQHPDYGPKLIAYELRTEKYGNVRIDPDLIYSELVKLRLNTQKLRERYLQKGSKQRIKQPGTPLLTLDGNVIMNYESAEQEIARRKGAERSQTATPFKPPVEEQKKPPTIRIATNRKADATYIHKTARPTAAATPPPAKAQQPVADVPEQKSTVTEPEKAAPVPKDKIVMHGAESPTREELLAQAAPEIKQDQLALYLEHVQDDFEVIRKVLKNIDHSEQFEKELKNINLVLKIALKHPVLKEIPDIKKVYMEIQQVFETVQKNVQKMDLEKSKSNLKQLLKYFEKENKFKDYNEIVESINRIGWLHRQILKSIPGEESKRAASFDQIRAKLANKKIISNESILESISGKTDEE